MAAPNSCEVCGCIPPKMSIDFFRQKLLVALCAIYNAFSDATTKPEATPYYSEIDYSILTGGFILVADWTNSDPITMIDMYNGLDVDVHYSLDGLGNAGVIPTMTGKVLELGTNGMKTSLKFFVNDDIADATTGYFGVTGWRPVA